jgi:SAM-dependent methyltransferase
MMKLHELTFRGLRICELGCTQLRRDTKPKVEAATGKWTQQARRFFQWMGATSVSIDINGKYGSLPLDLREPLDVESLGGKFDLVLNAGTTEHIDNQEAVFANIFSLCKPSGIAVHIVPAKGTKHGLHQYSADFFASDKQWRLSHLNEKKGTLYCTLQRL